MPYSLRNRNVLVVAGSRGVGAMIAVKFAKEGANLAITYIGSHTRAEQVAKECEGHGAKTVVLQADGGKASDMERIVKETKDGLGGLDVIIGNQGYTEFTDFGDLNALSEETWNECWSVNVFGQMVLLRAAKPIFDANTEGGVFIMTGSVAGMSIGGSSMPYCVTKAAQIHLTKCLAQTQGPKCRVNCVLPGLLLTDWSVNGYTEQQRDHVINTRSVLKKPTDLEDCADAFLMIAKNASMTGQMVTVDAGLNVSGR